MFMDDYIHLKIQKNLKNLKNKFHFTPSLIFSLKKSAIEQIIKKRKGEKWQNAPFDPSPGQKERWRNSGTEMSSATTESFRTESESWHVWNDLYRW